MTIINIGFLSIPVYLFKIKKYSCINKKYIGESFYQYRCTKKMEHLKKSPKINLLKHKIKRNEIIDIDYFEKKRQNK